MKRETIDKILEREAPIRNNSFKSIYDFNSQYEKRLETLFEYKDELVGKDFITELFESNYTLYYNTLGKRENKYMGKILDMYSKGEIGFKSLIKYK